MYKKILIINPPNIPFTEKSILIEPIDILTLSSYLQTLWYDVSFLDMDAEHILPKEIVSHLKNIQPDVVILPFDYHIPLHQDRAIDYIIAIGKTAKKLWIKTIVGGKIATYKPAAFLFPHTSIDIAISYEMELPLSHLLAAKKWNRTLLSQIENISFLYRNKIISTSCTRQKIDIATLPIADRTLCNLKKYIEVRSILSSRGCVMKCSYCHVPNFRALWRGRSPEVIIQEIQSLIKNFGTEKIMFLDDNFGADRQRMEKIADLIIQNNITCKFWFLATIHSFDEKLFKKLYKAGCRRVHYGIETGDEQLSQSIQKNLSNAHIKEVIAKTRKIGFRIRSSWIVDLPWSTSSSIDKTMQLILDTKTDEIRLHFLTLRLGSKVYTDFYDPKKKLPSQYIHNNKIHNSLHTVADSYIYQKISTLITTLQKDKYIAIQNSKDNKKLHTLSQHQKVKVISFCPLRYWLCR